MAVTIEAGDLTFLKLTGAVMAITTDRRKRLRELREAQVYATKALPKLALRDHRCGEEQTSIHKRRGQWVDASRGARSIAYGEKLVYFGTSYKSMKIDGDKVILSFDQVGSGLVQRMAN